MGGLNSYHTDGYRLCRKRPVKGRAPVIDIYNDRRAGMTFPGANHPGYFCIFGLKDVVTHRDKLPLELLAEGEFEDQTQLFAAACRYMRMMRCSYLYADCSLEFQSSEVEFDKYVRRNSVKNVGLFDASEFEGFKSSYAGFEAARAPLDEYGRKGLLKIHSKTQLKRELRSIQADDFRTGRPWESFPAINAFNHIIMSYVISPWQRPAKEYSNSDSEGYCG